MGEIQRVDIDNVSPHTRRLYVQASIVALLGNVLLVIGKGAAALVSGSSALYADAANSAADVAYSMLMGVGLWLALQPPDPGHPHGHRRIESLVSLFIEQVCRMEWESDLISREFARRYYALEGLDPINLILLEKLCHALTRIADHAENVGKNLRLVILQH